MDKVGDGKVFQPGKIRHATCTFCTDCRAAERKRKQGVCSCTSVGVQAGEPLKELVWYDFVCLKKESDTSSLDQDRKHHLDINDEPDLLVMKQVIQMLLEDVAVARDCLHSTKNAIEADYNHKLQRKATDLYCRINERVIDLERIHKSKIEVIRRASRQQLANALATIRSHYKKKNQSLAQKMKAKYAAIQSEYVDRLANLEGQLLRSEKARASLQKSVQKFERENQKRGRRRSRVWSVNSFTMTEEKWPSTFMRGDSTATGPTKMSLGDVTSIVSEGRSSIMSSLHGFPRSMSISEDFQVGGYRGRPHLKELDVVPEKGAFGDGETPTKTTAEAAEFMKRLAPSRKTHSNASTLPEETRYLGKKASSAVIVGTIPGCTKSKGKVSNLERKREAKKAENRANHAKNLSRESDDPSVPAPRVSEPSSSVLFEDHNGMGQGTPEMKKDGKVTAQSDNASERMTTVEDPSGNIKVKKPKDFSQNTTNIPSGRLRGVSDASEQPEEASAECDDISEAVLKVEMCGVERDGLEAAESSKKMSVELDTTTTEVFEVDLSGVPPQHCQPLDKISDDSKEAEEAAGEGTTCNEPLDETTTVTMPVETERQSEHPSEADLAPQRVSDDVESTLGNLSEISESQESSTDAVAEDTAPIKTPGARLPTKETGVQTEKLSHFTDQSEEVRAVKQPRQKTRIIDICQLAGCRKTRVDLGQGAGGPITLGREQELLETIRSLESDVGKASHVWKKRYSVLEASLRVLKNESYLRRTLERQAALLHQASVSYTLGIPRQASLFLPTGSPTILGGSKVPLPRIRSLHFRPPPPPPPSDISNADF